MACSLRKGAESISGDRVFQVGLVETIPVIFINYIICRGLQTIL